LNASELGNKDSIGKVLDKIQSLPSLPLVVMDILDSINQVDMNIDILSKKISTDQAIVARVLRVANSPFYGLSGQIDCISRAVTVLGFNSLRGLVMAAAVINAFPRTEKKINWESFWQHSICVAVCAKALAKYAGQNPETAFTTGVLHDVGKLVIAVHFPQAFSSQDVTTETLQAEQEMLGFDHAGLGGEVAKHWHFPLTIQQAILHHHDCNRVVDEKNLIDVIYIANLLAHSLDDGMIKSEHCDFLTVEAWKRLGVPAAALEDLADEVQQMYDGTITLIS
jgi:putative nucleotidyltransferase with HDIG domain